MSSWVRFKAFINRNILLVVTIPGIAGLHWTWAKIQEDERFVAKHERREFPPITLLKYARYMVGYGHA
ncbi:hypothetical protein Ocin01_05710 [Orchesella cincta]|uniref:Uncharacterized protein n=1 Tax=Orchesella cincta TaxID=48709 RepID=A0A1D2N6S5_ORCCI|nr:hypothetical protein Ocin01_05710 [Orchesella cincta]